MNLHVAEPKATAKTSRFAITFAAFVYEETGSIPRKIDWLAIYQADRDLLARYAARMGTTREVLLALGCEDIPDTLDEAVEARMKPMREQYRNGEEISLC